jgi:hypothetical protein
MTERQLTFIDVDENSLVLWLKEDRIQLRVVDSRPELEADELRAFASILFATYVGSIERSLRAIEDVAAVIAGVRKLAPPPPAPAPTASAPARRPRKSSRGRRASEGESLDWGWVRHDRDDASAVSA